MEYTLLIYEEEGARSRRPEADRKAEMEAFGIYAESLRSAGVLRGHNGLQPVATATTVRHRDGESLTTDGPFAETKEQLGGYFLIDCDNLDTALEWAAKVPPSETRIVEVRPILVP